MQFSLMNKIVSEKELAQSDWAEQRNFSAEKYSCPSRRAILEINENYY